jgi:hypothetical protein
MSLQSAVDRPRENKEVSLDYCTFWPGRACGGLERCKYDTIDTLTAPESQRLVLRFIPIEGGAVLEAT